MQLNPAILQQEDTLSPITGNERLLARRPRVVALGMETQHYGRPIELGLDLVLNIFGTDQDATEVARHARPFAAPHANWDSPAQGSHVQPSRSRLPRGRFFVRRR
jgi:hypothetical protein